MGKGTGTNRDTLITTWVCTVVAFFVILMRLAGRKYRKQDFFFDDWMALLSLILLWSRTGMIDIVLVYGTNNVPITKHFTEEEIWRRELGSKLTLATRILYAGFVWSMKYCMVIFYERLTQRQHGYLWVLRITKIVLLLTFIGVILSTLLECRPFNHYWQVVPNPGKKCTAAEGQLLTMGITNIITDFILILLPVPLIMRARLPFRRKLQLIGLFGVGIFLIIITLIRLPIIIENADIQKERTLWASVEIMTSALVVNFPILFTYFKDPKKRPTDLSNQAPTDSAMTSGGTGTRMTRPRTATHHSIDEADLLREPVVIETKQEIEQRVDLGYDVEKANHDVTTSIWTASPSGDRSHSSSRAESRHSMRQADL